MTFLVEGASPRALPKDLDRFAPEEARALGKEVYLYLPDGMGRSKLAAVLGRGTAGRGRHHPQLAHGHDVAGDGPRALISPRPTPVRD